MTFKYIYFSFILLFSISASNAQSTVENTFNEELANTHENQDWIPGLLNASSNPLYNMIVFNGRIFSWNMRGENQVAKIVDGIDWHSNIKQWNGEHLFTSMNYAFKKKEILINGSFSNNGYWTYPTLNLLSSENINDKKSITISSNFSNTANVSQTKSISLISKWVLPTEKLHATFAIKYEDAPIGIAPIGFKQSVNLFFSIDKKLPYNQNIGLTFLWNYLDRGKAATSVYESYLLSGQRTYSPNWGWYHQQLYYPNTIQINVPLVIIRYQKKWNENNFLTINNGLIVGKESQSNLEWNHTADPRPDYYKYLPSYIADSAVRLRLHDWYLAHPQEMQIHFDQLENINIGTTNKRSFYIVNQQNNQLWMMHGSLLFSHFFKNKLSLQSGVDYALDQVHNYNTIKDLLGGQFYYNYNTWMNDDNITLSFQNDINHPNKQIKQGENWGADYRIQSFQCKPWIQFQKQGPIFEAAIAMGMGIEGLNRTGYNQNGLYLDSKGKSVYHYFSTADAKGQLLYKLNGRLYFRTIVFAKWEAPNYQSVFVDPDINANTTPYLLQERKYGADLSVFYRAPKFKTSLSVYHQLAYDASDNKMFYHDAYALFVYGVIGNINIVQNGFEFVAETNLLENIKVNYVSTFSNSYFANNPNYQYLNVNDLQKKESGLLQLKNLTNTNAPKVVQSISLLYQPSFGFTLGFTSVFAQERAVLPNLFRRSQLVKDKLDPITWGQIQKLTLLEDQVTINAFISKSFQYKAAKNNTTIYKWNMSLSGRNLLNALIPVLAYEQTRFDYLKFNKDKFAIKYLMDAGTSCSLRFQLQIQ